MHRKTTILVLTIILLLSGCSDKEENADRPESTGLEEVLVLPERDILPLPEPKDLNADPMDMVKTIILDPQIVFSEDYNEILANNGSGLSGFEGLKAGDDNSSAEFYAESKESEVGLVKSLDEYEPKEENTNQAVLFRFKTENPSDLKIVYFSTEAYTVEFGAAGQLISGINTREMLVNPFEYTKDYNEDLSYSFYYGILDVRYYEFDDKKDFKLEAGEWYYILMTADDASYSRYLIWKEGEAENAALISYRLCIDGVYNKLAARFLEQKPKAWFTFSQGNSLNIGEYWVVEYEELRQ